jgi:hypothetical protein
MVASLHSPVVGPQPLEPRISIAQPGGHFDQLLRQTRVHHQQLSILADSKANMLLTVSSLVLTLAIPFLTNDESRLPAIALIVASLITVFLASYATMPKYFQDTTGGVPSEPSGDAVLFFGNFARMPYSEFERNWELLLNSPGLTYQAQIHEIYEIGRYLALRKFRYIRLAYLSFLSGLSFAVGLALYGLK